MKFETQLYQEQCVENIVNILEDINLKDIDLFQLRLNLINFHKNASIPTLLKSVSEKQGNMNRIDVMMETGTGKTFVYLKTIFELNKKHRHNKFIIFVPRQAIREGVLQNIKLTAEYFFSVAGYQKYLNVYVYRNSVGDVAGFINNKEELSVLILTDSSVNTDSKNLNKVGAFFEQQTTALQEISKLKPVIIIDEPHLMVGKAFNEFYKKHFEKNLLIRFGATFPTDGDYKISNSVYVLDSITAFRDYLVKRILVSNVDHQVCNQLYFIEKSGMKAVKVNYYKNGILNTAIIDFEEDIGIKFDLSEYVGISVLKIKDNEVYLSNQTSRELSGSYYLTDEQVRSMVHTAIRTHFEKEEDLFKKGIKELSLFFIPNIKDFRENENNLKPRIKTIFEEEYKGIWQEFYYKTKNVEYKKFLENDYKNGKLKVHQGYFADDKKLNDESERKAVEIILKDKESLLSFSNTQENNQNNLRFIFSVWALREGWDNPNIFNICKLSNYANSDNNKRQQVGRGLRLAVDQRGNRYTYDYLKQDEQEFYGINTLDMIVSSYEKDFIKGIQEEIIKSSFSLLTNKFEDEFFKTELDMKPARIDILKRFLLDNGILTINEDDEYVFQKDKSLKDCLQDYKNGIIEIIGEEKYKVLIGKIVDVEKIISKKEQIRDKDKNIIIKKEAWGNFKKIWETINKKAKIVYKNIEEDNLVNVIVNKFNSSNIEKIEVKIEKDVYNTQKNVIEKIYQGTLDLTKKEFFNSADYRDFLKDFISHYTLHFMQKIFNKIDLEKIKNNPNKAKKELLNIIKENIHGMMIEKIDYEFSSEISIYPNKLQDENGKELDYIKSIEIGKYYLDKESKEEYLFDKISYDSKLEQKSIEEDAIKQGKSKIIVYAKLPRINIPTPYKTYNPDFAYVVDRGENEKVLFLVVEAKGYDNQDGISEEELKKIEYAKIFFEKLQNELPNNIEIKYRKRINNDELLNLINDK